MLDFCKAVFIRAGLEAGRKKALWPCQLGDLGLAEETDDSNKLKMNPCKAVSYRG